MQTIVKQPADDLRIRPFLFRRGATAIERVTVSTPDGSSSTVTASGAIDGLSVVLSIAGGADGERCSIAIVAQFEDGSTSEADLDVTVIESVWQMPDGGPAYLPIAEFIARFGLHETVRMTDADGSGRIDRDLLIGALTDAQAEAEAYLGGRYVLPLAIVPRLISTAIADIARARLYPSGAADGIAAAAKNARRTLERVADGSLTLGVPAASQPAAAASDTPVLVAPGRRQYPDGLADY